MYQDMYQRLSATIAPVPPPSSADFAAPYATARSSGAPVEASPARLDDSRRPAAAGTSWAGGNTRQLPPSLGGPGSRPSSSRK